MHSDLRALTGHEEIHDDVLQKLKLVLDSGC